MGFNNIEKEHSLLEFKTNPYPGLFIDIDGLDGSGQSTQIELLNKRLYKEAITPVLTKEPAEDCCCGQEIRQILRKERQAENPLKLQEMFVANRKDHLERVIVPSLKNGGVVITDRYLWSTITYGSLDIPAVELIKMNQDFILPDITVFLDVSPQECLKRITNNRPSQEFFVELEKMEKIHKAYKWLTEQFSNNITVVNGEREMEEIAREISNIIRVHPKFSSLKTLM